MTAFYHSVYCPQKFGIDWRNNTISAQAREGKISREDAWNLYNTDPVIEEELVSYFIKRLKLSKDEYDSIMNEPLIIGHNFQLTRKDLKYLSLYFLFFPKPILCQNHFI